MPNRVSRRHRPWYHWDFLVFEGVTFKVEGVTTGESGGRKGPRTARDGSAAELAGVAPARYDARIPCSILVSATGPFRILHADGDSFFASCEIALDPTLTGRPVWVGGGRRGDGIVIAGNRLAKKFGVKTGWRVSRPSNFVRKACSVARTTTSIDGYRRRCSASWRNTRPPWCRPPLTVSDNPSTLGQWHGS